MHVAYNNAERILFHAISNASIHQHKVAYFLGFFSVTNRNVFEMTEKIKSFWAESLKFRLMKTVTASFETTETNDRNVSEKKNSVLLNRNNLYAFVQ